MKNKKNIKNRRRTFLLLGTSLTVMTALTAWTINAQEKPDAPARAIERASKNIKPNSNLLANKIDGKLLLKAELGYVYNFSSDVSSDRTGDFLPESGGSAFGGGVSLGYTHKSGWGVSADYLGFNHSWQSAMDGDQYKFSSPYHVITVTPSYRLALDKANHWGVRFGLGLGVSVSDQKLTATGLPSSGSQTSQASQATTSGSGNSNGKAAKVAGGAAYGWTNTAGSVITVFTKHTNKINSRDVTVNCFGLEMYDALGDSAGAHAYQCLDNVFVTPNTYNDIAGGDPTGASIPLNLIIHKLNPITTNIDLNYVVGSGRISKDLWTFVAAQARAEDAGGPNFRYNDVMKKLIRQAGDQFEVATGETLSRNVWTSLVGTSSDLRQLIAFVNNSPTMTVDAGASPVVVPYNVYKDFVTSADKTLLTNFKTKVGSNLVLETVAPSTWLSLTTATVTTKPDGTSAFAAMPRAFIHNNVNQSTADGLTFVSKLLTALKIADTAVESTGANAVLPYNVYSLLNANQKTDLSNALSTTAAAGTGLNRKLAGALTLGDVPSAQWTNPNFINGPVTVATITANYQHLANANNFVTNADNLISFIGQLIAIGHGADLIDAVTPIPYSTYTENDDDDNNRLASATNLVKTKLSDLLTAGKFSYGAVPAREWLDGDKVSAPLTAPIAVANAPITYAKAPANTWVSRIVTGRLVDQTKFNQFLAQLAVVTPSTPTASDITNLLGDPVASGGNIIDLPYILHAGIAPGSKEEQLVDALVAAGMARKVAQSAQASSVIIPMEENQAEPGASRLDQVGFILAPQIAIEYDDNFLHADVNVKYIQQLNKTQFIGGYTEKAGPIALFIGAGIGVNF